MVLLKQVRLFIIFLKYLKLLQKYSKYLIYIEDTTFARGFAVLPPSYVAIGNFY